MVPSSEWTSSASAGGDDPKHLSVDGDPDHLHPGQHPDQGQLDLGVETDLPHRRPGRPAWAVAAGPARRPARTDAEGGRIECGRPPT